MYDTCGHRDERAATQCTVAPWPLERKAVVKESAGAVKASRQRNNHLGRVDLAGRVDDVGQRREARHILVLGGADL